jgi:hypothetical protein
MAGRKKKRRARCCARSPRHLTRLSLTPAPSHSHTLKQQALATEAGALERAVRVKVNGTKAAGLAADALAKANAKLGAAMTAGRKLRPDLSKVRDKLSEADAKAEGLADGLKVKGAE